MSKSISLFGYWEGKVILVLLLASLLFICKDYIEKFLPQLFDSGLGSKIKDANPKFVLIPTILMAVFAIWLFFSIEIDMTYIKYGIGFWLLWIGIICLLVHSFIYKKPIAENNSYYQPQQTANMMNNQYVQPTQTVVPNQNANMMNNQFAQPTQTAVPNQNANMMNNQFVQPTQTAMPNQNANMTNNQFAQPTQTAMPNQNANMMNNQFAQPTQTAMPNQNTNMMNNDLNANVKICPNCGSKCNINADRCFMCGKEL